MRKASPKTPPPKKKPGPIALRLKRGRQIRGLSARELSRRAGLNPGHVAVLESRDNDRVWPATIKKLAKVLHVDASWLMYGQGPPPEPLPATSEKRATKGHA